MTGRSFRYSALDSHGAKDRGVLAAETPEQAAALLRGRGLIPISLTPSAARIERGRGNLGRERTIELLRSLGLLLNAGSTLTAALAMIRDQGDVPGLTRLTQAVETDVAGGVSVSIAFARALPGGNVVPALLAAGEASGDLAGAFTDAAAQMERDGKLADEFWAALSYPLFILAASVVAVLILLLFVTPSIAPLLAEAPGDRPWTLGMLIGLSDFVRRFGLALILSGLAALVVLVPVVLTGTLDGPLEALVLEGPARGVFRALVYGRFAEVLGRLLSAGVPAPDAFQLACASIGLRKTQARLRERARGLFEGARVSRVLEAFPGIPGTIVRMAQVGEESGSLGAMLQRSGEIEQAAAVRRLQTLARWLGPAMIAVLGAMIGLVMASLLVGVTSLGSSILS